MLGCIDVHLSVLFVAWVYAMALGMKTALQRPNTSSQSLMQGVTRSVLS